MSEIKFKSTTAASDTQKPVLDSKLSLKEICEKLTSIKAIQIELIGSKIGENIVNQLAPS